MLHWRTFLAAAGLILLPWPAAEAGSPTIRVSVRILDRPFDYPAAPAVQDIEAVDIGQDFVVRLIIQDVRPGNDAQGVFAAYLDLNFSNPEIASLVPALPGVVHPQTGNPTPFLHNTISYGNGARPDTGDGFIDSDGNGSLDQIDVIGSFSDLFASAPGNGEFILVEFAMTAQTGGQLTISAESTSEDPADDPEDANESVLFGNLVYGQDEFVCPNPTGCLGSMEFVADSITVGDALFSDGFESP